MKEYFLMVMRHVETEGSEEAFNFGGKVTEEFLMNLIDYIDGSLKESDVRKLGNNKRGVRSISINIPGRLVLSVAFFWVPVQHHNCITINDAGLLPPGHIKSREDVIKLIGHIRSDLAMARLERSIFGGLDDDDN
ncbi:hypothetical protein IKF20_00380 [Candidatus Saccharibacteria bacterium]|nr:hypothetical protein [Candidatus Saccharibacteria bacterium]